VRRARAAAAANRPVYTPPVASPQPAARREPGAGVVPVRPGRAARSRQDRTNGTTSRSSTCTTSSSGTGRTCRSSVRAGRSTAA